MSVHLLTALMCVQVAGASSDPDTTSALNSVHAAVSTLDVAAADALWHAFTTITSQIQQTQKENATLAKAFQTLKVQCVTGCNLTSPFLMCGCYSGVAMYGYQCFQGMLMRCNDA